MIPNREQTSFKAKIKRRIGFGSLSSLLKSLKCTKICLHKFAKQMH